MFVGNESGVALGQASHRSELFLNNGNGTFTEISHKVGIDLDDFVKGVVWGDVNNDGLPDLFASVLGGPNRLYLNRCGRSVETWQFEDVSARAGVQRPTMSFPAWFWDYDNDGWQDILVLSYDIGPGSLHDAVAMEYLGLLPAVRQPNGAIRPVEHSRLYRNMGNGTFGLGTGARVRQLHVRWPDAARSVTTYHDVAVNRAYRVVQGQPLVLLDRPAVPFRRVAAASRQHTHAEP